MSVKGAMSRRKFLFGGAVAAEGARAAAAETPEDSVFQYDLSAFEDIDPGLLLYEEASDRLRPGFDHPTCLAVAPDDRILVGGDRAVAMFQSDGAKAGRISLDDTPRALAALPHGPLVIAYLDRIEIRAEDGRLLRQSAPFGDRAYLTALAATDRGIWLADAGHREIIHCDAAGREQNRFGRLHSQPGAPGFVIPSPYFDLALDPEGALRIANPGRHHVERFEPDGIYMDHWGHPAMTIEGFAGCCNPTHFCVLPDGGLVTSEKGLNRIKVYTPDGSLRGVVAGPKDLVEDADLARRACDDCRIGYSLPVAASSTGWILALDPASGTVRQFRPKAA